jgi:hypothetical protein
VPVVGGDGVAADPASGAGWVAGGDERERARDWERKRGDRSGTGMEDDEFISFRAEIKPPHSPNQFFATTRNSFGSSFSSYKLPMHACLHHHSWIIIFYDRVVHDCVFYVRIVCAYSPIYTTRSEH